MKKTMINIHNTRLCVALLSPYFGYPQPNLFFLFFSFLFFLFSLLFQLQQKKSMVASFSSLLPPPAPNEKCYKHTTRANDFFERHLYNDAIIEYTKVLQMSTGEDEFLALIYSNRSASYIKINEFAKAYKDAIKVIELAPLWSKVRFLFVYRKYAS